MKRVLIFGTFDLLHPGHHFVIIQALSRGETHIVVARDETVERIKGKKPKQKESERLSAIKEAFPETHPLLGDVEDYLKPVREVNPDMILLGYDQKLPPGISEDDLPCTVERLEAFEPEKWKSSLQSSQQY